MKQRDTVSMPVDEVPKLLETGRKLIAGRLAGQDAEVLDDYVARAAAKRSAYLVEPRRVVSWDHRRPR